MQLSHPILLTFTTRDSGCAHLLVFCSWRPHVACLLMCSLGYRRGPPQGALGGWAGLGAGSRGKHQFFQSCRVTDDHRSYSFLLTLRSLVFVFVFLCMLVRRSPFLCADSLPQSPAPGRKPVKRDRLGVKIRQITDSLFVFGQIINHSAP